MSANQANSMMLSGNMAGGFGGMAGMGMGAAVPGGSIYRGAPYFHPYAGLSSSSASVRYCCSPVF